MSKEDFIVVDKVTYRYPQEGEIFKEYSWTVGRGESWAVLGPSGCGKTTLLYLLAGLAQPQDGKITIGGHILERPRPHSGLIIQEYGLLPWSTVRENARLGLDIRGFYGPDGTHAPRERNPEREVGPWLDRLGLTDQADKYPAQISGGQRQRTAIARTLVLQPDLLLMDEPFSSLDAPTREGLQDLTLELQEEQNLTLILVTHTIEEAAILGRKILLLQQPPNIRPKIISNPGGGDPTFRGTDVYHRVCAQLRSEMEEGA